MIQIITGIRHKVVFFITLGEIRSSDDVRSVLADFTPLSLWGASLHPAGKRGWSDVGGLRTVKEALVESLLWPGKVFFRGAIHSGKWHGRCVVCLKVISTSARNSNAICLNC